jgi:transposase
VRRLIPECLPREKRVRKLDENEIPEELRDRPLRRFEKKVGEYIELQPSRLTLVEEYVEVVAIDNEDATETAMVSARPEPRLLSGLPGNSLLAGLATWRFADHLPYYRLEEILQRHKLQIDRATQCRWMIETARRVRPLVDRMRALSLISPVVQADETVVKMLAPGQGQAEKVYLWTILGDRAHPYTTFSFTEDRSRAGPDEFFRNYRGVLVCDAYTCYESLSARSQERIELAGCYAHARRKFEALHKVAPTELTSTAMGYFQRLFDIEHELTPLADEERLAQRQRLSKPLLEQFKSWLDRTFTGLRPRHELRGAIEYMTRRWGSFTRFLGSGAIPIHNNASEQAIRLAVIGEKNWIFLGSPHGGHAAATLYSLTATCRRLQIDPHRYLCDVFRRLPGCDPAEVESLTPLLPDIWLEDHPEARLEMRVAESQDKAERKRRQRAERKRALERAQRKRR